MNIRASLIQLAVISTAIAFGGQVATAQSDGTKIDSDHSTARLILSSSQKAESSINVGVARMNGEVRWNANDPAESVFKFTAYPADENEPGVSPDDKKPGKNIPDTANYTVITFKSNQVVPGENGTVRVAGDLTVTRVERIATYDPSEAYSGPTYGPAIVRSVTREAVFVFQQAKMTDAATKGDPTIWVASSLISGEDFPQLLNAVEATDWPVFVSDEQCTMPLTVGEDFSGPACTGERVDTAARTDVHCEMPSTVGEDFSGEVCTGTPLQIEANDTTQDKIEPQYHQSGTTNQLVADQVKIQLAIHLAQGESTQAADSGE